MTDRGRTGAHGRRYEVNDDTIAAFEATPEFAYLREHGCDLADGGLLAQVLRDVVEHCRGEEFSDRNRLDQALGWSAVLVWPRYMTIIDVDGPDLGPNAFAGMMSIPVFTARRLMNALAVS